MSWDFNVLKVDPDRFNIEECEEFFRNKGYNISIHPDTNIKEDSGFLPIRIAGDMLPSLEGKNFITGFEIYNYPTEEIEADPQPKSRIKGLFGKKPQPIEPIPSDDTIELFFSCTGSDLLGIFVAHLLGLYFMESQDCECYDPQDGIEYKSPSQIEKIIQEIKDEMELRFEKGTLLLHDFDGWG